MESTLRRTWAEIDLDALAHNYRTLRAHVGQQVKFLGVVKADSYGHGCIRISRLLQELGADYLAVSSVDEAAELRRHDITLPILILGYTPDDQVEKLIELHVTQAVTSPEAARAYSAAAVSCGGTLKVHIKADTGMSRVGFLCQGEHFEQAVRDITEACRLPGLEVEGIFTHFAVSDESDRESVAYTQSQLDLFRRTIAEVEVRWGRRFALRHCANTGATANWPGAWMDMIRPGLLLYGCGDLAAPLGLKPVMRLKTSVGIVKTYDPGTTVSYGRIFRADRITRMGVVPIGYADGLFRALSNRCTMMTAAGPAPQRGRICMDMCMIDLTDLPEIGAGDEVEVFGEHISVNDVAALAGTIPYEITCAVSKRVPRVYLQDGQVVETELLLRP